QAQARQYKQRLLAWQEVNHG
ncbi:glutathione-regulated potassium-efflux system ancillary protein KefF, partial [Pectobacterium atrosepticum]|nr:glutathione-regulated potassium-efflux system ancillary protein KefF [Pectobacterium atrosepticum]